MPISQGNAGGLPGMTLKAWAQVKSDGTLVKGSGVASVTKWAAGFYTVNLSQELSQAVAVCRMSCVQSNTGATAGNGSAGATGTASIQVATTSAGAAFDLAFFLEVYE